jgi:hypothetical protein
VIQRAGDHPSVGAKGGPEYFRGNRYFDSGSEERGRQEEAKDKSNNGKKSEKCRKSEKDSLLSPANFKRSSSRIRDAKTIWIHVHKSYFLSPNNAK